MIDVVYVLGRGSLWGDNEIRYSLRSIEKHLKNFANIWVIGHLPDFLKNVHHIAYPDNEKCKEANIYKKILRACQQENISDDFLFMNDDHFLLADFDAENFPFYWRSDLRSYSKTFQEGKRYKIAIDNAYRALYALNLPTNSFDVHAPILYNKNKFIEIMTKFDWSQKVTYIIKSLYANSMQISGEQVADCKINTNLSVREIEAIIEKRSFFSMGNGAICKDFKEVLDKLYPYPSKYERF